jgi:hypothetical protein
MAANKDGSLRFRSADGGSITVDSTQLVRWSTPASPRAGDELLLSDGSQLCLAPAWGTDASISLGPERALAATRLTGLVQVDRSDILAILWRLPPDDRRRLEIADRLLAARRDKSDGLLLDNDDILKGRLIQIGLANQPAGTESRATRVVFESTLGQVELPLERVRGTVLSPAIADRRAADAQRLVVGLQDGSLIFAESLIADESQLVINSAASGGVRGRSIRDVAFLQGVGDVVYLSDVEPSSYRHEPYLELAWPYRRDRNVLGGPLVVRNKRYLKGMGMHSAARITFPVDPAYRRFAATIAVDDAARGGGSMTFRVMIREADAWRAAYETSPLRGGDRPRRVEVDLGGAPEVALVVDYGERGNELDYADWIDARLER